MQLALSVPAAAVLGVVVLIAGTINGVAGFGFALVGTMALAMIVDPAVAVVVMILPILAANLTLVRELSVTQLQTCGRRFWPLILSALVGTVVGMVVLDSLPVGPLRVGLGLVSLAFVATAQRVVALPGVGEATEGCIVETPAGMAGIGSASGLLFGGTNVGVQLIAFLRSCDLSHSLFVGVVAMVFLGLNAIRVGVAGALGLYPNLGAVGLSLAAAIPAVIGVNLGQRVRSRVSERARRTVVLGLLTVIGVRLLLGGLGIA